MGTWGPGNFDSDAALDYIGRLLEKLCAEVDEGLAKPTLRLDELERTVLPVVAVLGVLARHAGAIVADNDRVAAWRKRILGTYDAQIAGLARSADYKHDRRATIVATLEAIEAKTLGD